jgi:RNA polymerase primary sigma factor
MDPESILIAREREGELVGVLHRLTPVQEYVIRQRFGLDGDHPWTLEEVGESLGRSKERIRQMQEKALRILRHPSAKKALRRIYGNRGTYGNY